MEHTVLVLCTLSHHGLHLCQCREKISNSFRVMMRKRFNTNITKRQHSVKIVHGVTVLSSEYRLIIMIYVCTKFSHNILESFTVMKRTRFHNLLLQMGLIPLLLYVK